MTFCHERAAPSVACLEGDSMILLNLMPQEFSSTLAQLRQGFMCLEPECRRLLND